MMNDHTLIFAIVALFLLISIYWYWIFELIDHLLKKSRLSKILRIPVGMFNALFVFLLSALIGGTMIPYLLTMFVLFLEFRIFYSDTLLRSVFCTAACVIHVLALRAITTGIFFMVTGISIYEISNTPLLYAYSVIATFIFLNIALRLVLRLLPLDQVRIVNAHRDQQLFMLGWMIINIAYLLFNSAVAENPVFHIGMVENQIVAPFVIMIGTYIMLFFAIRTGKLLGYKEKNVALELTVSKEKEYRHSITKDSLLTYEFNLTKDLITSGFENAHDAFGNIIYRYSDMLSFMIHKFVYSKDVNDFAKYASPSNITKEFKQGHSELIIEYRRLYSPCNYVWCRAVTNLVRDAESGDLIGFTHIKNIDTEKRHQIELQYKAERDSLTGLYNKGVTQKLIKEHLLFNHTHSTAALFMIDVDNFKAINDHLGHVYGDTVLCELSKKLLQIFHDDDIVGRIGGDEFIAYIKNGVSTVIVDKKGADICKAFCTTYHDSHGQAFELSSSIGVAISPKDGITFEELYNHADIALYAAKKAGKNNCKIYDGARFSGYQSNRT